MAPRRKPKNTRMDAALDAMRPYGFSDQFVRETVKNLLKVYGEDGWYFFENDSYNVLLETLLEKQTNGAEGKDSSQDDIEAPPAGPSPFSELILPSCSKPEATYTPLQTNEALDSTPQTLEALDTASTSHPDAEEGSSLEEGEIRDLKDSKLEKCFGNDHMDNVTGNNDEDSGGIKHLGNNLNCSPPGIHSPQPVYNPPTQRRRPYYGWIGSDEEQSPVHVTTSPFPREIARFLLRMDKKRKRKTRCDVKPEDM
ncbi:Histone-lysine N-methyltransferase [Fagus crenata]